MQAIVDEPLLVVSQSQTDEIAATLDQAHAVLASPDRLHGIKTKTERSDSGPGSGGPEAIDFQSIDTGKLATLARAQLSMRDARRKWFPNALFREPGWQILLDLAVAEETNAKISVSSACIASGAPPTTALRHIKTLCDLGFVDREADPHDSRRVNLALTSYARRALWNYLISLAGQTV